MLTITFILDWLSSYYLFINTCFFISLIISIMYFFNNKKTLIFILISSILYDLLFSNYLFLNLTGLYLLYYIVLFLKNRLRITYYSYLLVLILGIISFYSIIYLLLVLLQVTDLNFRIFNIILNYLVSSIIFSYIYYCIFNKLVNTYNISNS